MVPQGSTYEEPKGPQKTKPPAQQQSWYNGKLGITLVPAGQPTYNPNSFSTTPSRTNGGHQAATIQPPSRTNGGHQTTTIQPPSRTNGDYQATAIQPPSRTNGGHQAATIQPPAFTHPHSSSTGTNQQTNSPPNSSSKPASNNGHRSNMNVGKERL